jgi:hypothetical protein
MFVPYTDGPPLIMVNLVTSSSSDYPEWFVLFQCSKHDLVGSDRADVFSVCDTSGANYLLSSSHRSRFAFFSRQRNYVYSFVLHTISGLLDSVDGILAPLCSRPPTSGEVPRIDSRSIRTHSSVCTHRWDFSIPHYIIYFFLEIRTGTVEFHVHAIPAIPCDLRLGVARQNNLLLSQMCRLSVWEHPRMRLFRWYGSDVFHTLLVLRYILIADNDRKFIWHLSDLHFDANFSWSFALCDYGQRHLVAPLRTMITSCYLLDKLYRMAHLK